MLPATPPVRVKSYTSSVGPNDMYTHAMTGSFARCSPTLFVLIVNYNTCSEIKSTFITGLFHVIIKQRALHNISASLLTMIGKTRNRSVRRQLYPPGRNSGIMPEYCYWECAKLYMHSSLGYIEHAHNPVKTFFGIDRFPRTTNFVKHVSSYIFPNLQTDASKWLNV